MPPTRITLPHLPPTTPLYITLYTSVQNSPQIHTQLLASNPTYNYTFIDARTLLSPTHLLSACLRALTDNLHGRLKSNNVHSEIVLCLSGGNNVGEALRRFGISAGSTEVVVVKVGDGREGEEREVREQMEGIVEGREISWGGMGEWLGEVCDLEVVRGCYRLGRGDGGGKKGGGGAAIVVNGDGAAGEKEENAVMKKQREMREIERVVLGLMALRGAT